MGKPRSASTAYCTTDELMNQIKDTLKDENGFAFIVTKIADLVAMKVNKRLDSLEKESDVRKRQIKHLKEKATHLESKLDDLEQYNQRESYTLRIQA